jgi:hypothetical protein
MIGEGFVSKTNNRAKGSHECPLKEGHIALPAESQPIDFRKKAKSCRLYSPKAKKYKTLYHIW